MRKFIITEEEKKEILKQYNLLEQDIVDTTDIGNKEEFTLHQTKSHKR